jgi:ABC-type sugar transport system ATPase subunit
MIAAEQLRYRIGSFSLDAALSVGTSEYFVLLGMTGSGKTLFLECLAGLRPIHGGRVFIGGRDVTAAEPRRRNIGYVPQDGALFAHLRVRDNIGFALRVRRIGKAERDRAVAGLAEKLGVSNLLDRPIEGLSGGERQRVALARALASRPAALLLDEPVSDLDEFTREAVCRELVRLQEGMAIPVIHVCHSSEEARMVADRVGIMEAGRIVQTGTPDEIMAAPASPYVARVLRLAAGRDALRGGA